MFAKSTSTVSRIPTAIWVLGFVSMLMDISSELVHSLLPVFLVAGLGASALTVGMIEGVAEATALIVKVFSGTLSDYLGRRKGLAVLGYSLGAISKPLFAIASSAGLVFFARFVDRIGKGIRGAPRDALVAELAPPTMRGAAFGLRQSLDTVGAFCGPLLAIALMLLWSNDFRAVFWFAVIPGALAVALLVIGVREPARRPSIVRVNPIQWAQLRRLSGAYWWVVAIGAAVSLARFSEAFLILRAEQTGLALAWVPLVLVAMNIVYALSAYPFGRLSDTVSKSKLLAFGLVVLISADLVLAFATSWNVVFAGVALWGLSLGITQGLFANMVASAAPQELLGTAFGFFNLFSGLAMLIANVVAGLLWDQLGAPVTFYFGAVFSALALILVTIAARRSAFRDKDQ
ncbi:MAG: MFS transporter [Proteobacteria bacterium]|nr:MFS transporter [Pseudomonadota bacterium]